MFFLQYCLWTFTLKLKPQLVLEFPHSLYLTFDVEDFINDASLGALHHILQLLAHFHQTALFFVTGHMAEKLPRFPHIVEFLAKHDVGYHSTSHSVHPNIFEYTDTEDYEAAYRTSLRRETAHINPLTGAIEGRGGIKILRDVFPHKKIEAFRAPGFSWSPPHLEAIRHLGMKNDFSTNISRIVVKYRGITFFPFPSFIDSVQLKGLLRFVTKRDVIVLDFHPSFLVNANWWDAAFCSNRNPASLSPAAPRTAQQVRHLFHNLTRLLRTIYLLRKSRIIESNTALETAEAELDPTSVNLTGVYRKITQWPISQFHYAPRYMNSHLSRFFTVMDGTTRLSMD